MIDLDEIVKKIQAVHSDLLEYEIREICEDYLSKFPKKTKEESKRKSLNKFVEKEFELDTYIEEKLEEEPMKKCSLDDIPSNFWGMKDFGCRLFDQYMRIEQGYSEDRIVPWCRYQDKTWRQDSFDRKKWGREDYIVEDDNRSRGNGWGDYDQGKRFEYMIFVTRFILEF